MPRFVILTHDWPTPHWDFLVEASGILHAWRLLAEPRADADIPAEPNADHRLFYLDYEGPVSGGRGNVIRWDGGSCTWYTNEPDCAEIGLRGAKLNGRAMVRRVGAEWTFRFMASAPE